MQSVFLPHALHIVIISQVSYTEKIVIPNSLPEPNLLRTSFQEFGITFLSLAVFPIQKCFEYH